MVILILDLDQFFENVPTSDFEQKLGRNKSLQKKMSVENAYGIIGTLIVVVYFKHCSDPTELYDHSFISVQ